MTNYNMSDKINQEVIQLFKKYVHEQVTAEELNKVMELFMEGKFEAEFEYVLNEELTQSNVFDQIKLNSKENTFLLDRIENTITSKNQQARKPSKIKFLYQKYGAAMLFVATCMLGIYLHMPKADLKINKTEFTSDISSGTTKAYLTLANGNRIELNDENNVFLASLKDVDVTNVNDGILIYGADNEVNNNVIQYNTIEIPRAGQYQLILDDGTKVWLNSATSLKYPTSFKSLKERIVDLDGEAYFEVAHNKNVPFKVRSHNQVVEVLGTKFNLNSYEDEPAITTSLVTGKVRVSSSDDDNDCLPQIILDGQQATFTNSKIIVQNADIDAAIAWKNDDFIFKNDDFKAAMRKISRWYDVEIIYENTEPLKLQPGGWISRNNNISTVLDMIELTGNVHFKIVGRRVIVKT